MGNPIEFGEIAGGGSFFKPADHDSDVALLIEVERFARQEPTPHGPKDTAYATITSFPTASSLKDGSGAVNYTQIIRQTVLARDLEPLVGKATIVKLDKAAPSKPGQNGAWVWRQVDSETRDAVVVYVTEREAKAAAEAADAPSFV